MALNTTPYSTQAVYNKSLRFFKTDGDHTNAWVSQPDASNEHRLRGGDIGSIEVVRKDGAGHTAMIVSSPSNNDCSQFASYRRCAAADQRRCRCGNCYRRGRVIVNHFLTLNVCDKPIRFFRGTGQDPTVWVSLTDLLNITGGQLRGVVDSREAHHEGHGPHQIVTAYRGRGLAAQLTAGGIRSSGLELEKLIVDAIEQAELEAGWKVEPAASTLH